MKRTGVILFFSLLAGCSGSGDQFAQMRNETFETTQITASATKTIAIGNASTSEEQHIMRVGFDPKSNAEGHFRIDAIKVGDQTVTAKDIVVPPGSAVKIMVTYTPQDLETSLANYGGWITGIPDQWRPRPIDEEEPEKELKATHRSIIELLYDSPKEGILYVQLVGEALSGPNGEVTSGGPRGECSPGDGIACYSGGFAIDIPDLVAGGPREAILTGDIRIGLSGGLATLHMDDFPPALLYLRSSEIPRLPSGVTATLVISGASGGVAEGNFDGSRLTLSEVGFRIRVALGELDPENVGGGISALADFEVTGLEMTTTEPFTLGNITLHIETKLSSAPTGDPLFDDVLGGARVIVFMRGQLAF